MLWRWPSWLRMGKSMPAHQIVLYTKFGCHLCDEAKLILHRRRAKFDLQVREIDVSQDAMLLRRWGDCVPVVEIDGKVRFRGRIDDRLLDRLLLAEQRLSAKA